MCCCYDSWPSLVPWPLPMGQEGLFVPIPRLQPPCPPLPSLLQPHPCSRAAALPLLGQRGSWWLLAQHLDWVSLCLGVLWI